MITVRRLWWSAACVRYLDRVRELLHAAGVLYADETPARAAGKLQYVHVACTGFLTAMHTGDRTSEAIDAGGILPGLRGHHRPRRLQGI